MRLTRIFLETLYLVSVAEIPPERRKFQQDLIVQWLGHKSWNPKFRNFLLSSFNIFLPTVCKNVNLHTLRFSYNCPSSLEAVSDHPQSSELSVAAPFRNQTSVPNKHRANGFSFIPSMLYNLIDLRAVSNNNLIPIEIAEIVSFAKNKDPISYLYCFYWVFYFSETILLPPQGRVYLN